MVTIDLLGQHFGKLTVISRADTKRGSCVEWVCKCDCGGTIQVPSNYLRRGLTKHCGCTKKVRHCKDITGVKHGRLTAVRNTGVKCPNGDYIWEFKCDCGNTCEATIGSFNYGKRQSCGCLSKEARHKRNNYHGMQDTQEYNSWRKMRERCLSESDVLYPKYGGAGIKICDRWINSFKDFYQDMGKMPFKNCTIDRIDTHGNYEPSNCRWVSKYVQARNKGSYQGSSKYKGVQYEKSSHKWIASIGVGQYRAIKIGRYVIEEHAALAYNLASELIFGEGNTYLCLNDLPREYSCVKTSNKFFKYWVPILKKEMEDKYEKDLLEHTYE